MAVERRESELLQAEQRLDARERELLRKEHSLLRRVTSAVRLADFMAILMVLATSFSGYAAWKTAQVTARMFAVADRPFIGVESVAFEQTNSGTPSVVVDFRDFGRIPAGDALIDVHTLVDGKPVKLGDGELSASEQGNVSPGVPHFFYAYLPADDYAKVLSGASNLMVHVHIEYTGPDKAARYCYFEKIIYDHRSTSFRHVGGSDKCGSDVF